jgi:hypothetical protein
VQLEQLAERYQQELLAFAELAASRQQGIGAFFVGNPSGREVDESSTETSFPNEELELGELVLDALKW